MHIVKSIGTSAKAERSRHADREQNARETTSSSRDWFAPAPPSSAEPCRTTPWPALNPNALTACKFFSSWVGHLPLLLGHRTFNLPKRWFQAQSLFPRLKRQSSVLDTSCHLCSHTITKTLIHLSQKARHLVETTAYSQSMDLDPILSRPPKGYWKCHHHNVKRWPSRRAPM